MTPRSRSSCVRQASPVATGEAFRDLLQAVADSGPDAAHPTALERFTAAHPAAATAGGTAKTPSSLARQTYNGVNAFVFVDKDGKRQPFRFRFVPVQGEDIRSPEDAAKRDPNFLMAEIGPRVAKTPATFRMLAQLAEPGDPTNDATKPWPVDRKTVEDAGYSLTTPVLITNTDKFASVEVIAEGEISSNAPLIRVTAPAEEAKEAED